MFTQEVLSVRRLCHLCSRLAYSRIPYYSLVHIGVEVDVTVDVFVVSR